MRPLGVCWILYGVWRLILSALLVLYAATATVMFGALLTRVSDPYSLMTMFHVVYVGLILYSIFCGALGILAGVKLMGHSRNARGVAMLAALFSLPELPLGLILGSFTLYAFAQVPAEAR